MKLNLNTRQSQPWTYWSEILREVYLDHTHIQKKKTSKHLGHVPVHVCCCKAQNWEW